MARERMLQRQAATVPEQNPGPTLPEQRPGPAVPEQRHGPTVFRKPAHMQAPKVQRQWKSDTSIPTIETIQTTSPAVTCRSSDRPKIPRVVPNTSPAGTLPSTHPGTPRPVGPPPGPAKVFDSVKGWGGEFWGKFPKFGPGSS